MRRLILLSSLVLAACATVGSTGSGGGQVTIETMSDGRPLADARCVVAGSGNTWEITPPATIAVVNVIGDLHIVCDKQGFRTSEMVLRPAAPYGPNIGFGVGGGSGGNVGVGVGFSVPVNLGGGGYPSRVMINMNPQ